MNKYLLSSLAVLSIGTASYAADNNDIILGFWAEGGTGAALNAEFVLADTLTLRPSQTLNVLTNINGLLTSTYGSNWNTRTDLHFGYAGSVLNQTTGSGGEIGRTVYAAANTTTSLLDGTATAEPYIRKSAISQGTPAIKIGGLFSAFGSETSIVTNAEEPNSWKYQGGNGGFGNFFAVEKFTNNVDFSSSSYVASDLFEMLPSSTAGLPGTYLGTFALYANGDVAFVNMASAIPEPSTYAAILGAAALGFAALRRRQLASA